MRQWLFASTLRRLSGAENHSRTSSQEDRVLRPFEGISEGFRWDSGNVAQPLGRLSRAENHVLGASERCVTALFNSWTSSQEDRVLRPFKGIPGHLCQGDRVFPDIFAIR